jgi:uncharacterized membrane protein YqhA
MNRFFNALLTIRYLAIVAVIGPFAGAILMLMLGVTNVIDAYLIFFGRKPPEGEVEAGEAAMITLVASVDHFLFATILMIFGIGLYSLFFGGAGKHDHDDKHLSWNHLKNLGGMDEMLLKVIIMLLAVSFLEFVLLAGMGTLDWPNIVIPLAIVALGLCLRWMSASADAAEEGDMRREELQSQPAKLRISLDDLERLTSLHDQGAIDDAEFAEMKGQLFAGRR